MTLTTIGFGDFLFGSGLAPGQKRSLLVGNGYNAKYLAFTGLYIIFGLALVSMCVDLMHNSIVKKFSEFKIYFFDRFEHWATYFEKRKMERREAKEVKKVSREEEKKMQRYSDSRRSTSNMSASAILIAVFGKKRSSSNISASKLMRKQSWFRTHAPHESAV